VTNIGKVSASSLLNRLMSRGKFRHIQILVQLAELGSLRRTADAIGVTQSSITQTLAHLESILGLPLFHRHARGVHPTDACRDLLPLARQVLLGVTQSAEAIAARHNHGHGRVRLLASMAAINGLLMDVLADFNRQHPLIQIHLREAEREEQLAAMTRAEVDLVACRRPPVLPEGWQFRALCADRYVIVCRNAHPLARLTEPVTTAALGRAVWLTLPAGSAARSRFDAFAVRFEHPVQIHPIVTRTTAVMWWLMLAQDLLALLPITIARPLLRSGQLKEIPFGDTTAIEPLGLLQPVSQRSATADLLSEFMHARGESTDACAHE